MPREGSAQARAAHLRRANRRSMTRCCRPASSFPAIAHAPASPRSTGVIAAVAIACAAIAATLGWTTSRYFTPAVAPPSVVRFQIPTTPAATLQSNFNRQLLAVSPDGTQVAMTADRLYIRSLADDEARPVPGTESFTSLTHPTFSPDGKIDRFWTASDQPTQEDQPGHRRDLRRSARLAKAGMGWRGAATPSISPTRARASSGSLRMAVSLS